MLLKPNATINIGTVQHKDPKEPAIIPVLIDSFTISNHIFNIIHITWICPEMVF